MQPKNKNGGVQFSERYWAYMLAKRHLRGTRRPEVFPIRENGSQVNDIQGQISNTLTARYEGAQATGTYIGEDKLYAQEMNLKEITKNKPDAQRIYDSNGIAKTLKGLGGDQGAKTGLYNVNKEKLIMRDGRDNRSCLRSGRVPEIGFKGQSIRRLTPTEAERLQGFPDSFTKTGIDTNGKEVNISDTQRYKCLGNAISTPVIKAIGERLAKSMQ